MATITTTIATAADTAWTSLESHLAIIWAFRTDSFYIVLNFTRHLAQHGAINLKAPPHLGLRELSISEISPALSAEKVYKF